MSDDLEDLINNFSNINVSATLLRAAKLSPSVKGGRTIGPDLPPISEGNTVSSEAVTPLKNEIKSPKHKLISEVNISPKNDLLDISVINTNVAAKLSEKIRKENVKKELENRLQILIDENKKRNKILEKAIQIRKEWVLHKAENDKQIYETAEKYIEDEILQSNKKTEKISNDRQRRLQAIALDAIVQRRKNFTTHYEKVCQALKAEKSLVECEEYNKNLKDLAIDFERLIQKIKSNNMGQSEILDADNLCDRIRKLDIKLANDIQIKKKQQEQQIKTQNQVQVQNNSQQFDQQQKSFQNVHQDTTDTSNNVVPLMMNDEALHNYTSIITFYNEKINSLASLEHDPNMKKFLAACRRNINIPVAAICAVTPEHMQDKFDKIMNFILGNTKKQSTSDVHVFDHPLAKDYCIRYLAKKFIAVAGTEISSNAQAAFPFASIIIAIWNRIPEFGKLLLGQFYTESIFLVPLMISRDKFPNDVQYKLTYGYYVNENVLEDFVSYNKRQAGIVRLFAAIMISHGKREDKTHPFPIKNGWKWLCNLMNNEPEMHDVCSTVIVEFLTIAAHDMFSVYGRQLKKLLKLMQEQYLPKLNKIEDGKAASKGKLEQVLDFIVKYNRIEKPPGVIAKNFW